MIELQRPQPLDPARHDRTTFDSGEPTLDDWLRRYAGQNRRGNTATTWVIADRSDRVVAYASLSMTSVDRSQAPQPLAMGAPDPVPALLLGRLAEDKSVVGLGIGTALVQHVLATAVELNEKVRARPSWLWPSTGTPVLGGSTSGSPPSIPKTPTASTSTY